MTIYAFSTENWSRPKSEVDTLMDLFYEYLLSVEEKFKDRNISFRLMGDRTPFSDKIKKAAKYAEEYTSSADGMILNVALNYGGRDEIAHAAREAAKEVVDGKISIDDITPGYLNKLMYTGDLPDVDLIIRPSGEKRLSNFLLWQAAYAEFWYSDVCWPDFSEDDMKKAIFDFQNRDRRYGNV